MFSLSQIIICAVIVTTSKVMANANYSNGFLAEANDYNISNRVVDIFLFTQYCGPSERIWKTVSRPFTGVQQLERVTYADLDVCCRQHDSCPNYIQNKEQYNQYPGLDFRNQYFARYVCYIVITSASI